MSGNLKLITPFMPFMGALCIGIYYALSEKVMISLSMQSYIFVYSLCTAGLMIVLHYATPYKLDMAPLSDGKILTFVIIAIGASLAAWCFSLFTIKSISASYAAIGEVSYPLFVALFIWLFFGARELDRSTLIGGILIIAGSYIVITDKIK